MSRPITKSVSGLAAGLIANRSRIERRLTRVKREFDRIFQSYVKGFSEEAEVREPLAELRAERKRLEADLASAEKPPESIALHPTALVRYREQVEDLQKVLSSDNPTENQEAIIALRELVAAIIVQPTPVGAPIQIEVRGPRSPHWARGLSGSQNVGGKGGSGGPLPPFPPTRSAGVYR